MQHISSHMSGQGGRKNRASERGDLMQYFMQKLNLTRSRDGLAPLTMARMGKVLQVIPTSDLYFLKSICDDASKRGDSSSFSKKFWWEVNPKNHQGEKEDGAVQSKARPKKRAAKKPKSEYDA